MDNKITIEFGPVLANLVSDYLNWGKAQCTSTQATIAFAQGFGNLMGVSIDKAMQANDKDKKDA